MKQEKSTTESAPMSLSSTTPSRFRPNTRPRPTTNGSPSITPSVKPRPSSVPPKARTHPKPQMPGSVEDQLARQRRHTGRSLDEEDKKKGSQDRFELSEALVKELQSQVRSLKTQLEDSNTLNSQLEFHNRKLTQDLASAEAKIAAFTSSNQGESIGKFSSPNFEDIQKLISNKSENSTARKAFISEANSIKLPLSSFPPPPPPPHPHPPKYTYLASRTANAAEGKTQQCTPLLPPPPPPPLPSQPLCKVAEFQKAPALVECYRSLKMQEGKRDPLGPGNHTRPLVSSAHSSIVGEIQNRSAHLLAIKADIETKVDFINGLIQQVVAATYTDIEDVVKFVDWLDCQLSSLADERAVLKHFNWPERKADAMREAAIEYRDLKLLESEISSYKDEMNVPCGAALKKMACLLDKSECSVQRLIKLRDSVMSSYQDFKIPTLWMLDSGIVYMIKQASMKLANMYMKRVTMEVEMVRNSDRESSQEALLLQGVHFAYRAHQFAGGLDSETLCAFEEIRRRVPGYLGGSREVLIGITS